jgi:phosphomannomutase
MLARTRAHPGGLAALVADLPARVTAANRLQDIDRAGSDRIIESLRAGNGPEGLPPIAARDETDGLRLTLEGGQIVHLRPSGNAPELRCYVETDDRETADRMLAFMLEWAAAQRESR